jgi:hypothetical protein
MSDINSGAIVQSLGVGQAAPGIVAAKAGAVVQALGIRFYRGRLSVKQSAVVAGSLSIRQTARVAPSHLTRVVESLQSLALGQAATATAQPRWVVAEQSLVLRQTAS